MTTVANAVGQAMHQRLTHRVRCRRNLRRLLHRTALPGFDRTHALRGHASRDAPRHPYRTPSVSRAMPVRSAGTISTLCMTERLHCPCRSNRRLRRSRMRCVRQYINVRHTAFAAVVTSDVSYTGPRCRVMVLIVPTLCVGTHPVTLRVTLTGRRASHAACRAERGNDQHPLHDREVALSL